MWSHPPGLALSKRNLIAQCLQRYFIAGLTIGAEKGYFASDRRILNLETFSCALLIQLLLGKPALRA